MTEQNFAGMRDKSEINPYVSRLASRLIKTAASANMPVDSQGWQLITEVLSFAASAEKRLSEQQDRIAYLEQLTVTDELTGIPNRRGLRRGLGRILADAARHQESGVLGFLDIDSFKEINDIHGHMAGDAVLRHVSNILRDEIRPQDMVARVSGDEFAIILTRCPPAQGAKRMRKIQEIINSSRVDYAGAVISVSCSIGSRAFDGTTDAAELLEDADTAMYLNKEARKGNHLREII